MIISTNNGPLTLTIVLPKRESSFPVHLADITSRAVSSCSFQQIRGRGDSSVLPGQCSCCRSLRSGTYDGPEGCEWHICIRLHPHVGWVGFGGGCAALHLLHAQTRYADVSIGTVYSGPLAFPGTCGHFTSMYQPTLLVWVVEGSCALVAEVYGFLEHHGRLRGL